jgi:flavin-dependent dehydrogenase
MAELLRDSDLSASTRTRVCAAGASRLPAVTGPDWLAIGDAAMAFDPLASQGLFNALYTGFTSADAVRRILAGDAHAVDEMNRSVEPVWSAYLDTSRHVYGSERRWADSPFWQGRRFRVAEAS